MQKGGKPELTPTASTAAPASSGKTSASGGNVVVSPTGDRSRVVNPTLSNKKVENTSSQQMSGQVPQPTNHVRDVSKSNLLGHHQDSSLFRNIVQNNKIHYEQRLKNEQKIDEKQ